MPEDGFNHLDFDICGVEVDPKDLWHGYYVAFRPDKNNPYINFKRFDYEVVEELPNGKHLAVVYWKKPQAEANFVIF